MTDAALTLARTHHGLGAIARDLFARARRRHDTRLAVSRLRQLDDHLLADIGIDRASIAHGVRTGDVRR